MLQQLPGISVVKSPCAAWEGCLGKGSGGFGAGEAGGGQDPPGQARCGHGSGSLAQSRARRSRPGRQRPGQALRTAQPGRSASLCPAFLPRGKWSNARYGFAEMLPKAVTLEAGRLVTSGAGPALRQRCGRERSGAVPWRWGEEPPAPLPEPGGAILSEPPPPAPRSRPRSEPRAAAARAPRAWRHGPCSLVCLLRESRRGSWRVAEAAMPIPLFITASYTNKIFTSLP